MRISDWSSDVCSSDLAAEDDALTIERAAEVPPDDRNPAMPSRHHHFRDFHRLRKLEAIMSVDREPARRAAIHQLLELARHVLQRLQTVGVDRIGFGFGTRLVLELVKASCRERVGQYG